MSVRRSSSAGSRKFWDGVDRAAAEVATWPEWKVDHSEEYREFWDGVDAAAEEVAKWPEWKIDRIQAAKFPPVERGHYSLIQFVPNRARAEGANVGIVVVCPKLAAFRVLMCESNDGPTRHFGVAVVNEARLDLAKNAFEQRLRAELLERPTLESLERAASLEGNALTITPPRGVLVDDINRVSARLLDELVRVR